jgi:hypothetical protein
MKSMTTITRIILMAAALVLSAAPATAQNEMAVGKAKEFIQLLQKGDFNGAYARVDSNLGFKATPDTFKSYWQNLLSKAGSFVEFKDATVESKDGAVVVTQVAKFEKGHVDLKVALDSQLKVAGFQYTNHKAAPPQASGAAQPPSDPQAQTQAPASPTPAT